MSWDQQQHSFGNEDFSNQFGGGDAQFGESQGGNTNFDEAAPRPARTESVLPEGMERPERSYNWASNRARYEYNENAVGKDGEAPRDEKLESELFEQASENQTSLDFSKYESIPIRVERGEAPRPIVTFDAADLHPVMKDNVRLLGYAKPTPVQTYSIPIVTSGKDLMACAQTGSGKTAAFLIPTLSNLFKHGKEWAQPRPAPYEQRQFKAEPLVLILAPTRELCSQIFDECRKFTYRSMLRPCAVYGGADSLSQLRQLERGCDILAAAPGRLMDFIERGKIGLGRVRYLVLDEADRMLDMGFESVIRAIVEKKGCNVDRQTLMFSATFPRAIRKLARDFLKPDYLFLKVGRVGGTTSSITQNVVYVEEENKRESLRELLNSQPPSRTLIFVETKRSADSLDQYLYERSFPSTSIHGDRTQIEREDALLAFKSGQCPILVATAVAARGIDIKNVMHVINFDMPNDMDEYIHRIGRTARVGKSGLATSFYNDRSSALAYDLAKLLKECKQEIPEFLASYVTEDNTWEEDLDEEDVPVPSYAGQEYIPQERRMPGEAPNGGEGGAPSAWDGAGQTGDYGSERPKHTPRDGDWDCPGCGVNNFSRRTDCFKCSTAKPEGLGGDSYGGGGGGERRDGEWDCPSCSANNFSRRTECFKCGTERPEGMGGGGGGERRGPPPRRDGDWDCSCGASNFARRTDCFKCSAPKGDGGDSYGAPSYGGAQEPEPALDTASWDTGAATAGWGQSEPAAPAASSGGWGQSEPAAPAASSGGWGQSEPAAPTPAPAPAASSGGWGQSEPAAASPAPSAGGWGQSAPASTPPPAAAAPAPSAGGWGQPEPAAPADKLASSMGNMRVEDSMPAAGDGWGAAPSNNNSFGWN
ncbi:P-loop containing nucleoside triphosphate hydrolase protein [Phycomyces blakesleeanus]|uniref:RNA helicase n=2 Tax=Phycomyces blakesleeanus TaxID=4837 RepID=A0ABR3BGQ5_PHYBL